MTAVIPRYSPGLGRGYGWVPDLPDHRDSMLSVDMEQVTPLPSYINLCDSGYMPPVYDQGQLGSCTANAIAAAIEYARNVQRVEANFTPSRLFIYYNERVIERTIHSDSGAMIRDGIKTVHNQGACSEALWQYRIMSFDSQPPRKCYTEASKHKVSSYQRVQRNINQMRGCLAAGHPFVFGFSVYSSFESGEVASTGRVELPAAGESLLGGHAVLAVGYQDAQRRFIVRNSWGSGWGQNGYFTMPYEYLLEPTLSADFWRVNLSG